MEQNKPKHPPTESTKDDSSDIEQVRQDRQGPPPEPKPEHEEEQQGTKQERDAEKGHA